MRYVHYCTFDRTVRNYVYYDIAFCHRARVRKRTVEASSVWEIEKGNLSGERLVGRLKLGSPPLSMQEQAGSARRKSALFRGR